MYLYGQYCPVARASEILADRWTPLIVRELLAGLRHFNDLDRGLPGISRALLVERLRRLQRMGIVERRTAPEGRAVEYSLTRAGPGAPARHRRARRMGGALGLRRSAAKRAGPDRPPLVDETAGPPASPAGAASGDRVRLPRGADGVATGSSCSVPTCPSVSSTRGSTIDLRVSADIGGFYRVWLGRTTLGAGAPRGPGAPGRHASRRACLPPLVRLEPDGGGGPRGPGRALGRRGDRVEMSGSRLRPRDRVTSAAAWRGLKRDRMRRSGR